MIGAVIYNGNHTLVVDLPTESMDMQLKLRSVGVDLTADHILLSDEERD